MYQKFYSNVAAEAKGSDVRRLLKYATMEDFISFAGGLPSKDAFPMEAIERATQKAIELYGYQNFQYGATEGVPALRQEIVKIMADRELTVADDELLITTGSQQALDICAKAFIDKGDYIICESPTYLAAINAFKAYQPNFLDAPMDDEGIIPEAVEDYLKNYKVKFMYVIPDFQNPTGRSLSQERRKKLVAIANQYDVLIIEDSPYAELSFDGKPEKPLKAYDTEDRVIYLSTFSKIVCPGLRLGWVAAPAKLAEKISLLKQATDLHTNQFAQYIVATYLQDNDINAQIDRIRDIYRVKRDAMLNAIEAYFPEGVYYSKPTGGMFIWAELPEHIETRPLSDEALEYRIGFVPGDAFYPNGGFNNGMRINFSNASIEEIETGIKRLGDLIKTKL
ncbi:MAG: 2-aminoadipate transaminase [Clostridiales bacterium]|jgi:2-aminoadipate transaminase|nr:2-aminoadipate transaminase [Clostridiales bacterium]